MAQSIGLVLKIGKRRAERALHEGLKEKGREEKREAVRLKTRKKENG